MPDDIKQLVVGSVPYRIWRKFGKFIFGYSDVTIFVEGSDKRVKLGNSDLAYSFTDIKKAINPWIIESLLTGIADTEPTSVSVLLYGSQKSNRFSYPVVDNGKFFSSTKGCRENSTYERFSYREIGRTDSGIYILHTASSGGGSATFHDILLVEICQRDLIKDIATGKIERCLVLNAIGSMALGDRFFGEIDLSKDGTLSISGRHQESKREHVIMINDFTSQAGAVSEPVGQ